MNLVQLEVFKYATLFTVCYLSQERFEWLRQVCILGLLKPC